MLRTFAMLFALLLAPSLAAAHAQLHGSEPPEGALLADFPAEVRLEFSESVAPLVLRWVAPDGNSTDVTGTATNTTLRVPVPQDPAIGTWFLSWRVVSEDGHPVGGVLTLHHGAPSAGASLTQEQGAARATAAVRLALLLGMLGAVGVGLHTALVARGAPRLRGFQQGAALLALLAASALVGLHGLDLLSLPAPSLLTATPWAASLGTGLALTAGLGALAAVIALVRPLALLAWGLAAASFAVSGHAVTAPPPTVSTLAMLAHGAALVWWMGLLPPLLADVRHPEAALQLRRFSTFAVPLVVLLVLSGGWLTYAQTAGDWRGLPTSAWGILLLTKLALVATLLALAALNRLRLTQALERGAPPSAMARSIRTEIALGLLILILAAGFRLAPPPRTLEVPPIQLHLHGESAMADLRLTPGRAGPVVIEMAFQTGDFSDLTPREVQVALTPADGSLEPIRTHAMPQPDGLWSTPELVLPFGGDWEIALRVLITDFDSVVLLEMVTLPR